MWEKDPWNSIPEENRLDFKVVAEPLATLATATVNQIEREWPEVFRSIDGAQPLLLLLTEVAITAYETIKYFCAEKPEDYARKITFSASAPPLLRSLLDEVYTVAFLGEDMPARVAWYYRSGWREMFEAHAAYRVRYGGDPAWTEWLDSNRELLKRMQRDSKVTKAELDKPKLVRYWPLPHQMKGVTGLKPENKVFFDYLEAWFYRAMSQESHLTFPGLSARGANFLKRPDDPMKESIWKKMRSNAAGYAVVLLLAFLTEVICLCRLELRERCAYLWMIISEYFGVAEELYEVRYRALVQ